MWKATIVMAGDELRKVEMQAERLHSLVDMISDCINEKETKEIHIWIEPK
jgi:hypothetical protein